ncbi:MAG: helix-turn-helix domain-containing protein [Acidiferrobacter sp.]
MSRSLDAGTVTFGRSSTLAGVEIMFARQNSQRWRVYHENYAICTCDTAAANWRYRRGSQFLDDRSFMLMEPGETHFTYRVCKPSDFQVLFLAPEVVGKFAIEAELPANPHLQMAQDNNRELFRACRELASAIENEATILEQQSRLAICVQLLLTRYAERRPLPSSAIGTHYTVCRVAEYLRAHFDKAVAIDELCAVANLSRFHLLHVFKKKYNVPPHAYQILLRVERARALLRAGVPLSDIAFSIGFADQSHFTRHFRQVMGTTPARYAQTARPARR